LNPDNVVQRAVNVLRCAPVRSVLLRLSQSRLRCRPVRSAVFLCRVSHCVSGSSSRVDAIWAVRLDKFSGNGPGLWLLLQQTYDLWHAERLLADDLERIPKHKAAA